MDEIETIKQLREQKEQLRRENELLKAKIIELEARLAQYENAHSPPSLRCGRNRKKDKDNKGNPGQKKGHKGVTKPYATPGSQVERCPFCRKEVVANDSSCPHEGKFRNNTIAQATLPKYEDGLPHRKFQSALNIMYGPKISPASIFDLTRRAAEAVQPDYDGILNKIRDAPIQYVDETGIHVQKEKHWIWTITTPSETFFVIRKSRGTKVLIEVLTRRFKTAKLSC